MGRLFGQDRVDVTQSAGHGLTDARRFVRRHRGLMPMTREKTRQVVEAMREVTQLIARLLPGPIGRAGPRVLDRSLLRDHVLLAALGDAVDTTAVVLRGGDV